MKLSSILQVDRVCMKEKKPCHGVSWAFHKRHIRRIWWGSNCRHWDNPITLKNEKLQEWPICRYCMCMLTSWHSTFEAGIQLGGFQLAIAIFDWYKVHGATSLCWAGVPASEDSWVEVQQLWDIGGVSLERSSSSITTKPLQHHTTVA